MAMVNVTVRHMNIDEETKDYAWQKAEKLGRYLDRTKKIEVILDQDSHRYRVEMIISATRGIILVGHAGDRNCMVALDIVANRMERQLTKLKEKLRSRRARDFGSKIIAQFRKKQRKMERSCRPKGQASPQAGGVEQEDWY